MRYYIVLLHYYKLIVLLHIVIIVDTYCLHHFKTALFLSSMSLSLFYVKSIGSNLHLPV